MGWGPLLTPYPGANYGSSTGYTTSRGAYRTDLLFGVQILPEVKFSLASRALVTPGRLRQGRPGVRFRQGVPGQGQGQAKGRALVGSWQGWRLTRGRTGGRHWPVRFRVGGRVWLKFRPALLPTQPKLSSARSIPPAVSPKHQIPSRIDSKNQT